MAKNGNKALGDAKKQKKDEFYTQLSDINNELRHYTQHFEGKVVFCNCDDPYESNFFKYFAANFNASNSRDLSLPVTPDLQSQDGNWTFSETRQNPSRLENAFHTRS